MRRLPPLALAYHGVALVPLRHDPHRLFVSPEAFVRQVARLRTWGYRLVAFGELARAAAGGHAAGQGSLTFDDGFVDNLETLAPVAASEAVPFTVFVVSGWLGRAHPDAPWTRVVTEEELRELAAAEGAEIGAHTVTHPDLSHAGYAEARRELDASKAALEAVVGAPVEVAAYPHGRASAEAIRAARDAGFAAACAANGRGTWSDPHFLPRQDVENGVSRLGLRLKPDGGY